MFHSPYVLFAFLALGIILFFILRSLETKLQSTVNESESLLDDFFSVFVLSLMPSIYILILLLAGTYTLDVIPASWGHIRDAAILILGTYQGVVTITAIGNFIISHTDVSKKREKKLFNVFSRLTSILVWMVGIIRWQAQI